MANIKQCLQAEIDLSRPVPEICEVIAHVLLAWPGKEKEILVRLRDEIDNHLKIIEKGAVNNGQPVRESNAVGKDQPRVHQDH